MEGLSSRNSRTLGGGRERERRPYLLTIPRPLGLAAGMLECWVLDAGCDKRPLMGAGWAQCAASHGVQYSVLYSSCWAQHSQIWDTDCSAVDAARVDSHLDCAGRGLYCTARTRKM
jgi:hypothetical protein